MSVDISKPEPEQSDAEALLTGIVDAQVAKAFSGIQKLLWGVIVIVSIVGLAVVTTVMSHNPTVDSGTSGNTAPDITQVTSSLSMVAKPSLSADPSAAIIGRVSALMTTSDKNVTTEELAFAYKLFSKRLVSDFGLSVGTFPENPKLDFIDRRTILRAYDEEETYLKESKSDQSLQRRQENTITDLNEIIQSYVPATGEKDAPAARKELLRQALALAKVWAEQSAGISGVTLTPAQMALYQTMQNRLSDRLDMTKP